MTYRRVMTTAFLIGTAALTACNMVGPHGINQGREAYNHAIQRTNDEQMLFNIVRLKYRESPFFMQVASISSQLDMRFDATALPRIRPEATDGDRNEYGFDVGFGLSDTPTITYTPLQGEEFTAHLMMPIDLDTIVLLYHSGWSVERIFAMTVQRLNGVRNAFSASGPTPYYEPRFRNFRVVAALLREMQVDDRIDIAYEMINEEREPVLYVAPEARGGPEMQEIAEILGIAPDLERYRLTTAARPGEPDEIGLNTRSLMGVMYYLSQVVEVPEADRAMGVVTTTRRDEGGVFNWQEVARGVFQVHSQSSRPRHAAVAVSYRDNWYYIDDRDQDSKSTFVLLSQLFQLEAGTQPAVTPVLTLPVGN